MIINIKTAYNIYVRWAEYMHGEKRVEAEKMMTN